MKYRFANYPVHCEIHLTHFLISIKMKWIHFSFTVGRDECLLQIMKRYSYYAQPLHWCCAKPLHMCYTTSHLHYIWLHNETKPRCPLAVSRISRSTWNFPATRRYLPLFCLTLGISLRCVKFRLP